MFLGKGGLKIYEVNLQENTYGKVSFNKVAKQLYWNHTSAWVFSCKFTAYFQNTFFTEHLRATTSEDRYLSVTLLKDTPAQVFFF